MTAPGAAGRHVPDPPSPHDLWVAAGEDRDRYRALLREHGYLLAPGDPGSEEASRNLPCGWPGNRQERPE